MKQPGDSSAGDAGEGSPPADPRSDDPTTGTTSTTPAVSAESLSRAVIYIRVSTKQQAVRDGNPEGYSLPTQREACQRKAEQLGAVVVDEYVDKDTGTAVDKRPAMQQLLARIEADKDIDYVIIYKLDRWARAQREDLVADFVLEVAKCNLISCSEPIDRTASGRLLHGMLASVNEYHSRNMSDEIKRKTLQKVIAGGTPGPARLGYRNVGDNNRRYVVIDPDVASLIQWCFTAYATGEWSVQSLAAEATHRGLRSRGGPNTPQKELAISQLHRILASPYYRGIVTYNGVQYQGKHEPLVDDETWQRVQDMLSSKANGEKQRSHHHYLKGTIWCGRCGSRLCVTFAKGKMGGIYPYYFCVGRQQKRTTCMLTYRPLAIVEEKIEEHYRQVQLHAEGLEVTSSALLEEASEQYTALTAERTRQASRIRQLEAERAKLLHAHYADAVPLDLLQSEQARIGRELASLKTSAEQTTGGLEAIRANVAKATAWAENCHQAYLASDPRGRRLMNQAFFQRVWVTEKGVVGWEYNQPFQTLMTRHGKVPKVIFPTSLEESLARETDQRSGHDGRNSHTKSYERRSPSHAAGAFSSVSLKQTHLAEGVGFEPTEGCPSYDFQSYRFGRSRIPPGRHRVSCPTGPVARCDGWVLRNTTP